MTSPEGPPFLDAVTDFIPYEELPDRELRFLSYSGDEKAVAELERRAGP